jgi:hypothetical protein
MTDTKSTGTKRSTAWVVVGIVVVALVALSVPFLTQDRMPETEVRSEAELFENVRALKGWADDELSSYDDAQVSDLAADGFERIAAALDELVHRAPEDRISEAQLDTARNSQDAAPATATGDHEMRLGEIDEHVNVVRERASVMREAESDTSQSEAAHHAASLTAHLVDVLTEHRYTFAMAEVRPLRNAAEAINPGESLTDQRTPVESFFRQAARSLLLLAEPSTPAWLEGRPLKPWPSPDVRTDRP